MEGPAPSYSCLVIHICWKVDSEARMEPPIHTEYLRSGGAMICKTVRTCQGRGRGREPVTGRGLWARAPPTLIFMVLGARAVDLLLHAVGDARYGGAPRHDVVDAWCPSGCRCRTS